MKAFKLSMAPGRSVPAKAAAAFSLACSDVPLAGKETPPSTSASTLSFRSPMSSIGSTTNVSEKGVLSSGGVLGNSLMARTRFLPAVGSNNCI